MLFLNKNNWIRNPFLEELSISHPRPNEQIEA